MSRETTIAHEAAGLWTPVLLWLGFLPARGARGLPTLPWDGAGLGQAEIWMMGGFNLPFAWHLQFISTLDVIADLCLLLCTVCLQAKGDGPVPVPPDPVLPVWPCAEFCARDIIVIVVFLVGRAGYSQDYRTSLHF